MRSLNNFELACVSGGNAYDTVNGTFGEEDSASAGSSSMGSGLGGSPPNNMASSLIGVGIGIALTPIPAISASLLAAYIQDNPSPSPNGMISDIQAP